MLVQSSNSTRPTEESVIEFPESVCMVVVKTELMSCTHCAAGQRRLCASRDVIITTDLVRIRLGGSRIHIQLRKAMELRVERSDAD
jgi:hypothetical protein